MKRDIFNPGPWSLFLFFNTFFHRIQDWSTTVRVEAVRQFYFLPLDHWLSLTTLGSSTMRITGDRGMIGGEYYDLLGFSMDSKFKILVSNIAQARVALQRGSTAGLLDSNGFSARDRDNDAFHANCAAEYNNVGFWYGACSYYNPHHTHDFTPFRGYCNFAQSTLAWTWFMR